MLLEQNSQSDDIIGDSFGRLSETRQRQSAAAVKREGRIYRKRVH